MWDTPQSVEEAGALVGAAITKCNVTNVAMIAPPKGMHSSFAISESLPSSELFTRLYQLRRWLWEANTPLAVAPSLLAVLMKLLGASSALAAQFQHEGLIPPLWSTPIRTLWVDCVVACHARSSASSAPSRTLLALVSLHPKSVKAGGGTRLAALLVLKGLWSSKPASIRDATPYDVLLVCQRALKSSGHGAPTFRMAAVQTACAVMTACRHQQLQRTLQYQQQQRHPMLLVGAMEDVALVEAVALIKLASADKYPEVRRLAGTCCSILAPMLLLTATNSNMNSSSKSPDSLIDEVLTFAYKYIDDEQTGVAIEWAEAVARLITTMIVYQEQLKVSQSTRKRDEEQATTDDEAMRFSRLNSNKAVTWASICNSLRSAVQYLVEGFVKVGGELQAARLQSPHSAGGRAVRIGISLTLVKLLNFHSISNEDLIADIITITLQMVGNDKQFMETVLAEGLDITSVENAEKMTTLFSTTKKSHADAGLARLATNRVLREGLMASETIQGTVLQRLILCVASSVDAEKQGQLNAHQLQVCVIEISHLLTTLGEAAGSSVVELIPILKQLLQHPDQGVRYETAICCVALATSFPMHGRKLFRDTINDVQVQHAELVTLASLEEPSSRELSPKRNTRFRRKEDKKENNSLVYQYAIHGQALVIAVLLRELPRLPGGIPQEFMAMAMSVAEILVCTQALDHLTRKNPGGVCTCVRAGYGILCGGLTVGAKYITPHIALIYGLWQRAEIAVRDGNRHFTADQDLICFDASLSSIVAFLEHCSELLLAVPDALSRTTMLLEQMLPLFLPSGRLETPPVSFAAKSRHESAKASIMEAFAWLPPGSYPMIANEVFSFALTHIQTGTESEVICSILPTLVNNEDKILDAKSLSRAQRYWQISGARELEDNLISLNSEAVHHGERESVLFFQASPLRYDANMDHHDLWGSKILGLMAHDGKEHTLPTKLHEVGTWRRPISPSCSSKVRLLDSAVQAFSATFGLKDGKEQQSAMLLLESLVPPILAQLARAIGVNTALTEQDRRAKMKEDNAAIANITAVLLSCLKALPLHEATHDIPIGLGPPWMNKAKDLLLTLLPSTSNIVRRAASEGLALLATLGVTEDAHTLQSSVLHSLDEVMQGNKPDGKPRAIPLEPVSAARAGSLLTLACIQRTAFNIRGIHRSRRGSSNQLERQEADSDALPTIQMMTRILPSVACRGAVRDAFVVRIYAMHSFTLLIAYSTTLTRPDPRDEDMQLLKKGVEMVEDNFLSCWTAVSTDTDQGQEPSNLAVEPSFLAVLLRTMSFLTPHLGLLTETDAGIAVRFSRMAVMIVNDHGSHPAVLTECLAFFEMLSENHVLLAPSSVKFTSPSHPFSYCVPYVLACLKPNLPQVHAIESSGSQFGTISSPQILRAGVLCAKLLATSQALDVWDTKLPSTLFAFLESVTGSRTCMAETYFRPLAVSRDADIGRSFQATLEAEICAALDVMLASCVEDGETGCRTLVRWVLMSRQLVTGAPELEDGGGELGGDALFSKAGSAHLAASTARGDAAPVFDVSYPCRWQVRCQAGRCTTIALQELVLNPCSTSQYEISLAVKDLNSHQTSDAKPPAFLVFHLADLLSAASTAVVATVDQSELRQLQEGGVRILNEIVSSFGNILDPVDPGVSILEQYSSQVLSATKHAVTAADGNPADISHSMLIAGCDALVMILKKGLISDPMVFKRMIRPVIPSADDLQFTKYGSVEMVIAFRPKCTDVFLDQRSLLLPRITKLSCIARIRSMIDDGSLSHVVAAFLEDETKSLEFEIGVHSAAIAIDGVRLLHLENLSLCGSGHLLPADEVQTDEHDEIVNSGLLFANMYDIDNATKAALSSWSACAFQAALLLSQHATSSETEKQVTSKKWINKLLPILYVGFKDSSQFICQSVMSHAAWSNGLNPEETMKFCLHGMRSLLKSDFISQEELPFIISTLSDTVFLPTIGLGRHRKSVAVSDALVLEACQFIQAVAASMINDSVHVALLVVLLVPLDAVQQGTINFEMKHTPLVVVSAMKAIELMVKKSATQDSLVNAMLLLSLDVISQATNPEGVRHAARALLATCFQTDAITLAKQRTLACDMAKQAKWDAWCAICIRSDAALTKSIEIVADALDDVLNVTRNVGAIAALRSIILAATIQSATVSIVMQGAGAQVIGIFIAYGTLSVPMKEALTHRLSICADSLKILMVSYNKLLSADESLLIAFVTVVFECWVAIIQYNGLPNQVSPHPGADSALGKIAAQAIMHVARTTPTAFKASMGTLSDHARAVLEFAVRSDMSGYVNINSQTAVKKKLDLRSFQK